MKIIIEGPDGAGKSTLAKKLSEQLGFPVVHFSKPESEEAHGKQLEEYKLLCSSPLGIIFDRCWYSELVYGSIMRDQPMVDSITVAQLEDMIIRNRGFIIHCTADVTTLWNRLNSRGEDYVTSPVQLTGVKFAYETIFENCRIPVIRHVID